MNPRPDEGAPGTWDELVPFVIQCCQSAEPSHRESGLSIIGDIAQWQGDKLAAQAATFKAMFSAGLADAASKIHGRGKGAPSKTPAQLFQCRERKQDG